MNKILTFACVGLAMCTNAFAANTDKQFKDEIKLGLPSGMVYGTAYTPTPGESYYIDTITVEGYGNYGELGREVLYNEQTTAPDAPDYKIFVPASNYLRMGGGMNVAGLTRHAHVGETKHHSRDSWNFMIGAGWNLSSYVRGEFAFQESMFKFNGISELSADYYPVNGMLYFDFWRRFVRMGDITYRRNFVPFMGVGAGIGLYDFTGTDGAHGLMVAAPRAEFGMNFMLTDLIGLDIAYQYQMIIGHGFGWQTHRMGVDNIGNVMATFRINF